MIDTNEPELAAECVRIRHAREQRGRKMVQRLIELGVAVGRPHIARAMVAAGVIADPAQAFTTEWIAPGGRAYVSRYPWGDEPPSAERCDFDRFDDFSILPTRLLPPSGYGLHAMTGSVWEWTADWYDAEYYRTSPADHPPAHPPERSEYSEAAPGRTAPTL